MNRVILGLFIVASCFLFLGNFQREIKDTQEEVPRLIRLYDTLYYDTKEVSKIKGRCGVMDGSVKPSVLEGEIPYENFTSNFEGKYGYQWVSDEEVDVYIDGVFWVFKKWDKKS